MASITFDKLAYTHSLRAGGFTEQQAEASAHALDQALRDSVATKEDLRLVKDELSRETAALRSEMRQEFAAVRSEMAQEFAAVRSEMAQEFATVRSEMAGMKGELKHDIVQQKVELLKWVVPLFLGQAALIAALVKLL